MGKSVGLKNIRSANENLIYYFTGYWLERQEGDLRAIIDKKTCLMIDA